MFPMSGVLVFILVKQDENEDVAIYKFFEDVRCCIYRNPHFCMALDVLKMLCISLLVQL